MHGIRPVDGRPGHLLDAANVRVGPKKNVLKLRQPLIRLLDGARADGRCVWRQSDRGVLCARERSSKRTHAALRSPTARAARVVRTGTHAPAPRSQHQPSPCTLPDESGSAMHGVCGGWCTVREAGCGAGWVRRLVGRPGERERERASACDMPHTTRVVERKIQTALARAAFEHSNRRNVLVPDERCTDTGVRWARAVGMRRCRGRRTTQCTGARAPDARPREGTCARIHRFQRRAVAQVDRLARRRCSWQMRVRAAHVPSG